MPSDSAPAGAASPSSPVDPDGPGGPVGPVGPDEIAAVFRSESGRAVASLVRALGGIDQAEEAVQDAFVIALQRWPETGLPPSPAGWIITTARNRGIDRHRRESLRDDRHNEAQLIRPGGPGEICLLYTSPSPRDS